MNYMNNNPIIIGIDHGYGNIKTAHCCFPTGVIISDKEPTFKSNLLVYNGSYYTVGEGHKEFISDKMTDGDYYILTLAAIARELNIRKQTSARVHLAAGLPLTWVSEQKDSFKAYLLQNEMADFIFRGVSYHVEFAGADIFPQGFSAVADRLRGFKGINMLCDIGNGTMNVMYINERRPLSQKCFTEKYGTNQCMIAVRENLMRQFGASVDDTILERVIRFGTADISERYLTAIQNTARDYTAGIFRRLREHEYDPELMRLYVVGGGSCMVKNFGEYDASRVMINDDICATAKGYELLSAQKMQKKRRSCMKQIYTTTLRLNLENEADRRAWEHLQSLDRREYRSVSKAVVSAVNAYFDRSKQLADDPYLETREKEDAFLSRIEDTISRSLQSCTPVSLGGILQLMQSAQPAAALVSEETEEDISAALDFADGF